MTLAAPLSWRQEVFCAPQQLQELLARPAGGLIAGLNLPNKQKAELPQLLERARALRAVAPRLPVCVHFAISPHNWTPRDPEASYQTLRAFAHDLAAIEGCSLLLVSVGGPRKKMDSLSVLERLAGDLAAGGLDLPLGVAFNPYFPDAERQQEERSRLRRKLQAGRGAVTAVYLQAGSDAARLDQSLQWLHGLLAELERGGAGQAQPPPPQQQEQEADGQAATRPPKRRRQQPRGPGAAASSAPAQEHACACGHRPQVVGSIFIPNRKLLAAMRFRPWGGVFLSDEYLSSVEAADRATVELLRVYARHGVMPLVETAVQTEAEVARVLLLQRAAAAQPDSAG